MSLHFKQQPTKHIVPPGLFDSESVMFWIQISVMSSVLVKLFIEYKNMSAKLNLKNVFTHLLITIIKYNNSNYLSHFVSLSTLLCHAIGLFRIIADIFGYLFIWPIYIYIINRFV